MAYLTRQCGRSRPGSLLPTIGRVAELTARSVAWGQYVVSWKAVNATRFAVYVDASLVTVTTTTEVTVPTLQDGRHNITVIALADTAPPAPIRPEWNEGDQALLQWQSVDDQTLARYIVDSTTVETVTITPQTLNSVSGGGTGRLAVGGRFIGSQINEDMILTVAADDRLEYSVQELTGSVPIAAGETAQLPFGAAVTFLDDPSTYALGAVYQLPLRIDTELLSDILTRGEHTFDVSAVTINSIEGSAAECTVFVPAPDVALLTVDLTFDPDSNTIFVHYAVQGEDAAGVALFTNLDVDGKLMADVDEISPTFKDYDSHELESTAMLQWDGNPGTLRLFVGIYTTWGHVIRQLERYQMVLPVPPAVLGVPEVISLEQVGTAVRARLAYTFLENDAATEVHVTRSGADNFTESVTIVPGTAGDIDEIIATIDGTDGDGVTVTVTAVASDGTNEGAVSNSKSITLDLHVPDAPASAWGVPA